MFFMPLYIIVLPAVISLSIPIVPAVAEYVRVANAAFDGGGGLPGTTADQAAT
jgi:hypothetical protein